MTLNYKIMYNAYSTITYCIIRLQEGLKELFREDIKESFNEHIKIALCHFLWKLFFHSFNQVCSEIFNCKSHYFFSKLLLSKSFPVKIQI